MSRSKLWWLAKGLEGAGMVLVLVGVMWSISLGMEDRSLESMKWEMNGLMVGGALFIAGWALERRLGSR